MMIEGFDGIAENISVNIQEEEKKSLRVATKYQPFGI